MQNDNKIFCYLLSFKNSVHHVVDISEKNGSAFGEGGVGESAKDAMGTRIKTEKVRIGS